MRKPSIYSQQANESRLKALDEKNLQIGDIVISSYGIKCPRQVDFARIQKIGSTGRLTVVGVRDGALFSMSALKAMYPKDMIGKMFNIDGSDPKQVAEALKKNPTLAAWQWIAIHEAFEYAYPMHIPFFKKILNDQPQA